jgi:SAM-dependent methyltransferase
MNASFGALLDAGRATRQRWNTRYLEGEQPWDTRKTPPEVTAFWQSAKLPRRGLALDLGCGPGTNVRYLARLGLHAIGVEIAAPALVTAARRLRAEEPHLHGQTAFVCADVCLLPFRGLQATYILDVGCFHSLPDEVRTHYVRSVIDNLALGGYYQLYAFDRPGPDQQESGPGGLDIGEVASRFTPELTLLEEVVAVPERRPCRWYLLRRDQ